MKKAVSILMVMLLIMSTTMAGFAYDNYQKLPEGSDAIFDDYFETMNTTRYTPWMKLIHMQTAADKENGVYGGEGGQVLMAMGVSPINPNNVIMGVDTSGSWRSTDGGKTWRQLGDGVYTWAVSDVKWHPRYERTVYIAESSTSGFDDNKKSAASDTDGVYRSNDAGKTWKQVIAADMVCGLPTENLFEFDNNNNVYALTSDGLFKSTDDGDNFTCIAKLVYSTDATKPFFAADYNNYNVLKSKGAGGLYVSGDGKTICACTYGGMHISRDGGKTWTEAPGDLEDEFVYNISVDPTNSNHWVCVTNGHSKVYKSFDAGKTWQAMSYMKYSNGKYAPASVKFGKVVNGKPIIYMVFSSMTIPLRYSTDDGATWQTPILNENNRFTTHYRGYTAEGLAICASNPDIVFFSFGDIIYKSTNAGVNFDISCEGFSGNYVNQFLFDSENKIWFAFTDKGLGVTDTPYNGTMPTAHMAGVTGTCASVLIDPNNHNHIFANSGDWYTQTMMVSNDGAKTWSQIPGAATDVIWEFLQYDDKNKNTIYSSWYTSYDNGVTWTKNPLKYDAVSTLNSNYRYSINNSYVNEKGETVKALRYTSDGGITWKYITYASGFSKVYADTFDANVAWAGHSNGVIDKITINNGVASVVRMDDKNGLTGIKNSIQKVQICAFAQDPRDKNHLVAGGKCTNTGTLSPGIYETRNGGQTWYVVPGTRGPMCVYTLQFSPVSHEVFIGMVSGGSLVYEYDNYQNTSSVMFSYDEDIFDEIKDITGKYGTYAVLPDAHIKDSRYEFAGYELNGYEYNENGEKVKISRMYYPGEKIMISYQDQILKAKFRKNGIDFVAREDVITENNVKINELFVEDRAGSYTGYYNYKSPNTLFVGLNSNTGNAKKGYAYYQIGFSGKEVESSTLTIDVNNVGEKGTLNIYEISADFDSFAGEKNVDKPYTVSSLPANGKLIASKSVAKGFSGILSFDITDYAKKAGKNGVIKLEYSTDSSTTSSNGLLYENKEWNKSAVKVVNECCGYASFSKGNSSEINARVILPAGRGTAQPVIGVYNKITSKLVNVIYGDIYNLSEDKETEVEEKFSGIDFNNNYIKCLIIDSFNNIKPLVKFGVLE